MASKKKTETEEAKSASTNFVHTKKLSVKTVCGKTGIKELPEDGSTHPLMRIAGTITNTKVVSTQFGDSIRFVGAFVAVDKKTGQMHRGTQCFLPTELEELFSGMFANNPGPTLEIKADIGMRYDEDSSVNYSYVCESLLDGGGMSDEELMAKLTD